ncbi:hypothetical protein F0562_021752 [Nyssa sinensis]|uniref:Ion transport domain-containing protein n=1 Tax=Nyssa sinensis TaxID=561372 RepID=A0A5J5BS95_9ASTE|nr:hypothetical protein F0562_021752 [Nyssa sinensis]
MRVQDESELESLATIYGGMNREAQKKAKSKVIEKTGRCFDAKVLSRVFPEDYEKVRRSVLDPRGQAAGLWNKVFFVAGLVSLFIDPLFFFLPVTEPEMCFTSDLSLQVTLTIIRSVTDVFYIIHIVVQFRTAYVAPSSRVLGRGELVIDPWKIAYRYLVKDFWVHLMAALPLPQACNCNFPPR